MLPSWAGASRRGAAAGYLDSAIVPFYLRPSAPTAADALICGDPARALTIAQHVMVQPRMSNHHRGPLGLLRARRRPGRR